MQFKFCAVMAAMLCVVAVGTRAAEPLVEAKAIPGAFSANVALTSEYFFRGLSQTDDAPALQGGMDYEAELGKGIGLYVGVWGSNVDFNEGAGVDGATVEIDIYGGVNGKIGGTGIGWDAGLIYYAYPGAAGSLDYDFFEVQAALSYDFGPAEASLSVNYSPDNFGDSGGATYTKLGIAAAGGKQLDLAASIARQNIDKNDVFGQPDYWEWNVSATVNMAGFDLTLAYTGTDIAGDPDGADDMVLFTVARSF